MGPLSGTTKKQPYTRHNDFLRVVGIAVADTISGYFLNDGWLAKHPVTKTCRFKQGVRPVNAPLITGAARYPGGEMRTGGSPLVVPTR